MSHFCIPSKLPRRVGRTLAEQTTFGGLEGRPGATGDKIRLMKNISPVAYPALSVRCGMTKYTQLLPEEATPNGVLHHKDLYVASGTTLYKIQGKVAEAVALVSDTPKQMVALGEKIYVFPDKVVYDPETHTCVSMEASAFLSGSVSVSNNYLSQDGATWEAWGFAVGDGVKVTISGSLADVETVAHYTITSISGSEIGFDRNIETKGYTYRVEKIVPDLEAVCVSQNRLWGVSGQKIYACAEGNPGHWLTSEEEILDSGDTLSVSDAPVLLQSGTQGEFLAVTPWQGQVLCLKQDRIAKILGSGAGQYVLSEMQAVGVSQDSKASLCEVAGALYYLSTHGVYTYDGAYPKRVRDIPDVTLTGGVGGSDGRCYYLYGVDEQGKGVLYAYNPEGDAWYMQDLWEVACMSRVGDALCILTKTGELMQTNDTWGRDTIVTQDTETHIALQASVTFCDEVGCIAEGLRLHKLYISCMSQKDSIMHLKIAYDGSKTYHEIAALRGEHDGWVEIPMPPTRCGYYHLRLDMTGPWRMYALHREFEKGEQG